ncbi:MAG TPA: phosphate-starvation-inducible PsiE family protein [Beijerinckiaceae bacterium]|nr:phosphate-starvation-inducible PsiE family protein [Beijerinckiaceae bacterium]HVB88642.1 phosphate-starvation-inducible PsiE family protein [Beijerinckiaceae bacterium]
MKIDLELRNFVIRIYDIVIDIVIIGLILLMLATLIFSFFDVLVSLKNIIPSVRPATINDIDLRGLVESVLDVFIIVELFSTFMGYFRTRHVRLSGLLDVTIVFSLREILVKLYSQSSNATHLLGLCFVVLTLVVARSIAARFSPAIEPYSDKEVV